MVTSYLKLNSHPTELMESIYCFYDKVITLHKYKSTVTHIFTISGANIHDFDMQNKPCIQRHIKSKYSK